MFESFVYLPFQVAAESFSMISALAACSREHHDMDFASHVFQLLARGDPESAAAASGPVWRGNWFESLIVCGHLQLRICMWGSTFCMRLSRTRRSRF